MRATRATRATRARKKRGARIVREPSELGRRILERLAQLGWDQSKLARELGVTPQSVSGMLRSSYISAPLAVRLSDLLGVTVKYLAPAY